MGFYWWTAVYTGRLLSEEARNRLRGVPREWLHPLADPRGRYILHAPGALHVIGQIDPALEKYEIDKGYVDWSDLERCLGPEKTASLVPGADETETLREYVKRASNGDTSEFGTYVVQGEYSSYDEFKSLHVSHNIVVKKDLGRAPELFS
jgi:hypothetical protein